MSPRPLLLLLLSLLLLAVLPARAQDDDIWRQVDLGNVDYQKARNHSVRLYCYYRCAEDGLTYMSDRELKLYRLNEGICSIDIRYGQREDDGAEVIAARNLVHPDRRSNFMDYYELKPYTFLEKARRDPKRYTIQTTGDTTRVYTKRGLAGTAVRDTLRRELRISYNALSPDTAKTLNLLIVKAHLSHVDCHAVYRMDDADTLYVPQGYLKRILFEGDMDAQAYGMMTISTSDGMLGVRERVHMRTEMYVDSVVYMTRDEYRADQRLSADERRQRSGYTQADIDRLRRKLGVPPLSDEQQQRIEDQRDWDEQMALWMKTQKKTSYITP